VATLLDPEELRVRVDAARTMSQRYRPATSVRRYRSLLDRIEKAGDDRPTVGVQHARVLLGLAAAEFEVSGHLEGSLILLDLAEKVAERAAASHLTAAIRGQRALLFLRNGETAQALAAFDAAAMLFTHAEPQDQMSILLNRGVLHLERGALDAAAADFEQCRMIAEDVGDRRLAWKALHNLGYVEFRAGRIPRALAAMEEAGLTSPDQLPPLVRVDQARVLREAGLTGDADRMLELAAVGLRAARLHQDLAETELVRAECALSQGDHRRARGYAASAQRRFARRSNTRWQRKAELLLLRSDRSALDDRPEHARPAALLALATRAEVLAAACRDEGRGDLARPADLLAAECRLRAGVRGQPVPDVLRTDSLRLRLQTREVRALDALHQGSRSRAAAEVRDGLRELGSYQDSFGSLDLRTAAAVHGVPLARIGLEAALATGRPAEVFAAVERARAISIRLAPVRPPSDQITADLLGELRELEETVRDLEGDADRRDEADRLRGRAAELQRRVRRRAWELEASGGKARASARSGSVRAAARDSASAFVTYVVHGGRWLAVRVTGRATLFDLAPAVEVAELARRVHADLDALAMPLLPTALRSAVRSSLTVGLARLDELLLSPLRVAGTPLVLSVTGPLTVLPWNLLPSRRGLPVVVAPSATAWLRLRGPRGRDEPVLTAIAGPGLHRAKEEAELVSRAWRRTTVLADDAAGTEAARSALAGSDVVHVAAHGSHRQDSPLFSSLRFADGPLYAYELDAVDGIAACVALSACDTGLATIRPGDEGLGLTSVLLHHGVRSVLAGVAKVGDESAAGVMAAVHGQLAAGVDSAAALATALAGGDPDAPAPFGCYGAAW
jgi:tetratricopeptide (TPR) repeat protein